MKKLPTAYLVSIINKLLELGNNPRPHGVKKLEGRESSYRVRVGDYRVIYEIIETEAEKKVLIRKIRHRRDIYGKK